LNIYLTLPEIGRKWIWQNGCKTVVYFNFTEHFTEFCSLGYAIKQECIRANVFLS